MSQNSALYAGDVVHTRTRPKRHKLHYKVFSLLLDLDEVSGLSQRLRLFSHNKWGVFSFWDKDHGDSSPNGLRSWVEAQLRAGGLDLEHPKIEVLCYPRIWGYVFNPLTVYFCSDAVDGVGQGGRLRAILYEVCNTFGERRTYIIPIAAAADPALPVRQTCAKELYVSPFVGMDCTYDFTIVPPGPKVGIKIDEADADGLFLNAAFAGKRQDLTDRTLFRALVRYPLMTFKVTAAIHWEALLLWRKGVKFIGHTQANSRIATTVVGTPAQPKARTTEPSA